MSEAAIVNEADLAPNLKQLWLRAVAAIEAKNDGYAITLLQSILQQEPNFLHGRKYLRAAAVRKNESEKKGLKIPSGGLGLMQVKGQAKKDPMGAINAIEKVLETDPHNAGANELLFDLASAHSMADTATFALETIYEGHPDNKKNAHRLAEHYLTYGQPEKAATLYNDMSKRDPSDLKALKGATDATARASMTKGGWDKENASFQDLIKNKDEAAEYEQASRAALTKEQVDEQLSRLADKYEENPNDLQLVKKIAELYEKKEDFTNALAYWDWAHQLNKGDVALETKVQRLRDKIRDLELGALRNEIEENPDAPDIDEKRAKLDELVKTRAENLITEARARVERNPTDPQLRYELGQHLYDIGEHSDAIQELQRAKNSPHIRTRVLLTLGKCFEAKNMNDLAVTQLETAVSELGTMDNVKKEILYTLGLLYEKLDNKEKSLEALKQIYEADYGYLDVAQRVEASYS